VIQRRITGGWRGIDMTFRPLSAAETPRPAMQQQQQEQPKIDKPDGSGGG
jgi:hypothetical protein